MKIGKPIILPGVLLVYLFVMACFGYRSMRQGLMTPTYFWGTVVITLMVIILLHFNLKKRERLRREREQDLNGNK